MSTPPHTPTTKASKKVARDKRIAELVERNKEYAK
jgi:hypothetical protein